MHIMVRSQRYIMTINQVIQAVSRRWLLVSDAFCFICCLHGCRPYVMHLYSKTNQKSKIHVLQERGLWFLRENWMEVVYMGNRTLWLQGMQKPNISMLVDRERSGHGSGKTGPKRGPLSAMGGDGTNIHGR